MTVPAWTSPAERSLQVFEPLLPAERTVLRAAAAGEIAKIGYRRANPNFTENHLRAEFVAMLMCGGAPDAAVAGRRLQIMGATIVGRLDLTSMVVPLTAWWYRCSFVHIPHLDGTRVAGSLTFADCALPGLRAQASRIELDLELCSGCNVDGDVLLAHAQVGRTLSFERLQLRAPTTAGAGGRRLVADGVQVGGDVILSGGLEAMGEVRFEGARIGAHLRADGARLVADVDASGARGVALDLDRIHVHGNVLLDAGFAAAGQVRLQQARIDGSLDCDGAMFDAVGDASWGDNAASLMLDDAAIGGALILRRLQAPLQGASLAHARVNVLCDDATTWGLHHVLDGFCYRQLGEHAPTDAAMRLEWLTGQAASQLGAHFRPQPWRQLIDVLRHMGRDAEAREIAIERERQLRKVGRIGAGTSGLAHRVAEIGHDLFGWFAGYGHRPWRLLGWAGAVWLLCGCVYWAAAQDGATEPPAWHRQAEPMLGGCPAAAPCAAPAFQPYLYSLELMVPLLHLQQVQAWAPARGARPGPVEAWLGAPWLQMLTWMQSVFGWIVAMTLVASVSGWADRDRRR